MSALPEVLAFLAGASAAIAFVAGCWFGRLADEAEERAERLAAAKEREAALRPETIWPSRTSQERGPAGLGYTSTGSLVASSPDVPGYWQERLEPRRGDGSPAQDGDVYAVGREGRLIAVPQLGEGCGAGRCACGGCA